MWFTPSHNHNLFSLFDLRKIRGQFGLYFPDIGLDHDILVFSLQPSTYLYSPDIGLDHDISFVTT